MSDIFNIPVVLYIFKRRKATEVINRISCIKPKKIYIVADGGRTEDEQKECEKCREEVEKSINWDCEIVRDYAIRNRGVFENIAVGAKRVFEQEEKAIFLEDDNLPSISFFNYAKELLQYYENDPKVLWICGTNYLEHYDTELHESYVFTRCLLPCGWASWREKFLRYYDGNLEGLCDLEKLKTAKKTFIHKSLFNQFYGFWNSEYQRIVHGIKPLSWDYQMDYSVRSNGFYGISPTINLIKNIGVDNDSIHGGNNISDVMTKRFCGIESGEIEFPLIHQKKVEIDYVFEKKVEKIILYPISLRVKNAIIHFLRRLLRVPYGLSIHELLKRSVNNVKNKKE